MDMSARVNISREEEEEEGERRTGGTLKERG
jgi:hypothetical protein